VNGRADRNHNPIVYHERESIGTTILSIFKSFQNIFLKKYDKIKKINTSKPTLIILFPFECKILNSNFGYKYFKQASGLYLRCSFLISGL
jgi:hypothetical protein